MCNNRFEEQVLGRVDAPMNGVGAVAEGDHGLYDIVMISNGTAI